jgi:hypothetical protein
MEGSQIKSVKTKMKERKLRSVVNWQGALVRKRRKINGRKRRSGCNSYLTIKRHVDTLIRLNKMLIFTILVKNCFLAQGAFLVRFLVCTVTNIQVS